MKKVLVRGPALSQSGYGEHTRFILRSLRSQPELFDIYLITIPWGATGWIWEDTEERTWIDSLLQKTIQYSNSGGNFDISLQVTIPNEFEKLATTNIGITAGIETTKIAPMWVEKSLQMDKIIVVSEHAKFGFDNTVYSGGDPKTGQFFNAKVECPVDVIGYPVKEMESQKIELQLKDDFNFLVVGTWIPRKNIENTIKWFVEEFYDQDIGLVVKTSLSKNCTRDRFASQVRIKDLLNEYSDRKCSVYLLHGDMTEEEMSGLYNHKKIKALVNIAHGEGFGLPMFEAAYNSMPVVTVGWGGQCDFLYMDKKEKSGKTKKVPMFTNIAYDIKPVQKEAIWEGVIQGDSQWCYAKEWSYKKSLRGLVKGYAEAKSKSKKLQKYLIKEFSKEKQYLKIAECVYGEKIKNIEADDLPKISIITSVYNGDEFIRPFLENITSQTIFEEKCELVMINANSPGNEDIVVKEYMKKYPNNIVYKKLDKDPGIYGVWNEAIKIASGEYITNANLDDRKSSISIERHAKTLFANDNISLVYADSFVTHSPNETFEKNTSGMKRYNFEQFSKEAMLRGNQPHNNPMWRKKLHDKHGYFDSKYKSAGDWEFFLRCAFGGEEFKKINDVLGLYYFNPNGISTDTNNDSWKKEEEKEIFLKYKNTVPDINQPGVIM